MINTMVKLNKIKSKLKNINLSKMYEKINFLDLKNMMNEYKTSRYYSEDKNFDDKIPYVEINSNIKKYYDCSSYSDDEREELIEIDILNKLNTLKNNKRDYKRNGY